MNRVLCHVTGPSGSGKTTLLKAIAVAVPEITVKDLDDFDNEASLQLKLSSADRKKWSEDDFKNLAELREQLMNDFIGESNKPIVFAGDLREGNIVIPLNCDQKYLIDVDAETSAKRALERSKNDQPDHRRTLNELPFDIREAQETIDFYVAKGYSKKTADEIVESIKKLAQY